ncbi:hypothetical protein HBH56_181720 [Parastagonospora nodorum]|uniref:Uncharacterized protein n=1 Tax=Phaeosphaeria nodorum (strain SN15 / ATCC MYA-4574 / FGSC 10173) TaxID=321614 RepID=Q0U5I0_PHANO|nr:hypothetical protein SNOG_12984 [Parastagonospora nodorum SN15]KAH3907848.1 hypothetical protein HBH56_181720 [Parastagonospora nodorum]EAT79784.1 hypothetical protein SNOG_12984 [Parastagonospora nodorum SN15]KAH3926185.1 hypothetical protein HBH54_170870 [Parastagonospora nodorum]KAH3965040.1 hypothetical protein HBH51_153370 [Parastagonospora nodorum]KAH3995256.1 hypothetical protein HBI10_171420 [Parastagonospora nodorum]
MTTAYLPATLTDICRHGLQYQGDLEPGGNYLSAVSTEVCDHAVKYCGDLNRCWASETVGCAYLLATHRALVLVDYHEIYETASEPPLIVTVTVSVEELCVDLVVCSAGKANETDGCGSDLNGRRS